MENSPRPLKKKARIHKSSPEPLLVLAPSLCAAMAEETVLGSPPPEDPVGWMPSPDSEAEIRDRNRTSPSPDLPDFPLDDFWNDRTPTPYRTPPRTPKTPTPAPSPAIWDSEDEVDRGWHFAVGKPCAKVTLPPGEYVLVELDRHGRLGALNDAFSESSGTDVARLVLGGVTGACWPCAEGTYRGSLPDRTQACVYAASEYLAIVSHEYFERDPIGEDITCSGVVFTVPDRARVICLAPGKWAVTNQAEEDIADRWNFITVEREKR